VGLQKLQKATGWQPHSVRGFLSGTLRQKMGLAFTSTKDPRLRIRPVEEYLLICPACRNRLQAMDE